MLTTDNYLFVLRGGMLYQFNIHSLELRNSVRLPSDVPSEEPVEVADSFEDVVAEEPVEAPTAQVADAVQNGLRWLAAHQDSNGRWDADEFMKHDPANRAPSDGPGSAVHDVGATGLALMAFLGDGNTLRVGPHREVVAKAVQWLIRQQEDGSGLIGTMQWHDFIYDHAIATIALCEAAGLSKHKATARAAQKALNYLESHRNPYAVWRYMPRDNDNDTSVTAWCTMAYASGRDFGMEVNAQAFKLIETWFDQVTDPATGKAGYTKRGEMSSRMPGDHMKRFPPMSGEAITAAALFCRALLGQDPKEVKVMQQAAETMLQKPPKWDEKAGTIDQYYWYFGSMAMYQMGGKYWKTWRRHLTNAVLKTQREDGSFAGSWDPVGVWGESGGRVYSTALMTMTMQVYYRYRRLVK